MCMNGKYEISYDHLLLITGFGRTRVSDQVMYSITEYRDQTVCVGRDYSRIGCSGR